MNIEWRIIILYYYRGIDLIAIWSAALVRWRDTRTLHFTTLLGANRCKNASDLEIYNCLCEKQSWKILFVSQFIALAENRTMITWKYSKYTVLKLPGIFLHFFSIVPWFWRVFWRILPIVFGFFLKSSIVPVLKVKKQIQNIYPCESD